ncbi:MAG: 2-hydroxyacyl-CoA dehydratase family protein, partial [Thermanaeromonas sp.]|uniref:2-hydroxyacyl-CoA dehydratase family protein n=1 Tax=Thermanaeromonas sp. TaxID=2003697 RepID=UPI00244085D0
AEETCTGTRYFAGRVEEEGTLRDQIKALARRILDINCACFTPNFNRVENILNLAQEWQADGVIYYTLQFCQTYALEARRVEKALKERGIPVLTLESDYSEEDVGQLKTRIEAFLEMLK